MAARKPGEVIDNRYEVVRELGKGAMGAVYLIRDPLLGGSLWALKELELSLILESERAEAEALFQREMHLLSGLLHPGIPRVVRILEGSAFIMEWIDGIALDEVQANLGRNFLAQEALPLALQVCEVLEYLHAQTPPVIFRDLKPSNLMLTPGGRLYFIDFGIARRHRTGAARDTQELGTPGYCAPEQYGHGQTSAASDLYAVGTTFLHLLSGRDPQGFNFQFPPLRQLGIEPEGLAKILERCLQLKPQDRYPRAEALRSDLEALWGGLHLPPDGSTQGLGLARLRHHPRESPRPRGEIWWKGLKGLLRLLK